MGRDRPKLTVATISKNEERDLPGFLSNFSVVADEIVIIDDDSDDATPDIARAAGSKVRFVHAPRAPGEGFADQRNKSIDAATGDWLLHVDVDNRITPEFARELLEAIGAQEVDAFRYRREQFLFQRPLHFGGMQHWNAPWLAKRGVARFEGLVHEQLRFSSDSPRFGQLETPMWHLADADFEERLNKNILYSRLEAERAQTNGKKISVLGALGRSLLAAGKTYVWQQGFRDGRQGLVWASYVLAGSLNRYLMQWERQEHSSREQLEEELAVRMKAAGLG
ncbi:MAG: glycosyltransferase family 2 protein [Myxococcales bacterium]|nr:glycosyltransferase family 2 protein [Myxococcales bacterium]